MTSLCNYLLIPLKTSSVAYLLFLQNIFGMCISDWRHYLVHICNIFLFSAISEFVEFIAGRNKVSKDNAGTALTQKNLSAIISFI